VACLPHIRDNPYQALLNGALERYGVRFEPIRRPSILWALKRGGRLDVLHLHWLEYLVGRDASETAHQAKAALRVARLLAMTLLLKARGVRVVWTVHNLLPHDTRHPRRDLALARLFARLADTLCASSKHAAEQVERAYDCQNVRVAYHGSYVGTYPPPTRTRAQVRHDLGLPPDGTVFLAFGLIREYKQLPRLVEAFRSHPDPDARLLVIGRPVPPGAERAIEAAAPGDSRIVLRWQHVPDEEVSELHDAADAAVLPYRDVFSSGALLLALSLGLPVIAPADTTATELAEPPAVLGYTDGQLAESLAATGPRSDVATSAALAAARSFTWDRTARSVLACYQGEPR
jgi:beta-1,4-mannosyltransferase